MTLFVFHNSALREDDEGVSVVDRLVGQSPERDVRWAGGSEEALGHEDGDHLLPGVRIPGGAHAAIPAVATRYRRDVVALGDHRDAESPAVVVKEARDQAGHRLLL